MNDPVGMRVVVPARLGVGERFAIKVKLTGELRPIPGSAQWNTPKPALRGPFNLNVERRIQYHDNCLPEWTGALRVICDGLSGPESIDFDGTNQGAFEGDRRPIRAVDGFTFSEPGFHFIRLVDERSGLKGSSNPVFVSPAPPKERIYFGDPHWQTFFSDGIRCPEELYAFARDEGFLDFGAITDHMEALTDRQWEYFQAVTNDFNNPGRFVTLIGQEWTNHAPGHRNLYFRADHAPPIRCTDPRYDTLPKLWKALDELADLDPIAIPHHPANKVMGVDWSLGWNERYEKAVEIHSVWGNSERHKDDGNPMAIQHVEGEVRGAHVVDALRMGYRMGFVGGGDVHDGRPGDAFHNESYPPSPDRTWPTGFTAAMMPALTRDGLLDAIRDHRTYATTQARIYLDARVGVDGAVSVVAASEDGIAEVSVVCNGADRVSLQPDGDERIVDRSGVTSEAEPGDFVYTRVTTKAGNMAWSSPVWVDSE